MHFRRKHPGIARCTLGMRLKSLAVTAGIAKELRVFKEGLYGTKAAMAVETTSVVSPEPGDIVRETRPLCWPPWPPLSSTVFVFLIKNRQ